MRRSPPIQVKVSSPQSPGGKLELAKTIAEIHADFVLSALSKLNCSRTQKLELLQRVIDAKTASAEHNRESHSTPTDPGRQEVL